MDGYIDDSRVVLVAIAMCCQLALWINTTATIIERVHNQVRARGEIMDLRGI